MIPYRAAHRRESSRWPRRGRDQRPTLASELTAPDAIDTAIKQDQLRLFYQPIVELAATSVIGHEVLIRWQHPELGLLGPGEFLPLIETDPDRSRALNVWILRQACAAAMRRNDQLHVSVNISDQHLRNPDFREQVNEILSESGFPPGRLILEITESSLFDTNELVVTTCKSLTDGGITFALDDFGVGAADLGSIDNLPLGILKIDRSVIAEIGTDTGAEQFIISALDVAAATGRRTIGEGVENNAQARFLREHDATYAQGYLYGRPKPR